MSEMEREKLTVYDLVNFNANIKMDDDIYKLEETMLFYYDDLSYFVTRYYNGETKRNFICGLDIEKNRPTPLSIKQIQNYLNIRVRHAERFSVKPLDIQLRDLCVKEQRELVYFDNNYFLINRSEDRTNFIKDSCIKINGHDYCLNGFNTLVCKNGMSTIASIERERFESGANKESLYNDVSINWEIAGTHYCDTGNIVRIESNTERYDCFIQPYSYEVMQSNKVNMTVFKNMDVFSIIDFVIQRSDSDVAAFNYPGSDQKSLQEFLVVGVLENMQCQIEDCSVGDVRIGNQIDTSEEFIENLNRYSENEYSLMWVNVKANSLYEAYEKGCLKLQQVSDLLSFMMKNDMYDDWYGCCTNQGGKWDVRNHAPIIKLGKWFYIENCILGENVTFSEESMHTPGHMEFSADSEYLLEKDWIEKMFCTSIPQILRLQYAVKWIVRAWEAQDKYDKVIYCAMALEFIVNGERGYSILDEGVHNSAGRTLSKADRKKIIAQICSGLHLPNIDGVDEETLKQMNTSIENIVRNALSQPSFGTKMDCLIERLNIPVSQEEKKLIYESRKIRNKLIHGLDMCSITTLEAKKLSGITSRIIMYKLLDILEKVED